MWSGDWGKEAICTFLAPLNCPKISSLSPIWWFVRVYQLSQVTLKNWANALGYPQVILCLRVLGVEDKNVLCSLLFSAAAAVMGRYKGETDLEKKSIKAIYSCSQLDSQQASHRASRYWFQGEPWQSLDWEGFLLMTATAATKKCWFCNMPLLKWWQGIWRRL